MGQDNGATSTLAVGGAGRTAGGDRRFGANRGGVATSHLGSDLDLGRDRPGFGGVALAAGPLDSACPQANVSGPGAGSAGARGGDRGGRWEPCPQCSGDRPRRHSHRRPARPAGVGRLEPLLGPLPRGGHGGGPGLPPRRQISPAQHLPTRCLRPGARHRRRRRSLD